MAIGITEEHEELRQAVRRFVDARIPPAVARAVVDGSSDARPEFWAAICEPGWLGLHVAESYGGAGYGLVEQAVVIEELGRACAPGPYLATVLAAAVIQAAEYRDKQREPIWPEYGLELNLAGWTDRGEQLRVAWFRHAKLEPYVR